MRIIILTLIVIIVNTFSVKKLEAQNIPGLHQPTYYALQPSPYPTESSPFTPQLFSSDQALSLKPNDILNVHFGNFHGHTSLSDGSGTPEEAFSHARDKGHADFLAITDHSDYFDNEYQWQKSSKWLKLKNAADKFNTPGSFAAIAGFEMTWESPNRCWGHINTFNTDWFESANNLNIDLCSYYELLSRDKASFSQWNHPGSYFGDFDNLGHYSVETDKVMKLIEIGNGEGSPGSVHYTSSYDYYIKALENGWHVAPSINQDNHHDNWITSNECRTAVLASSLSRDSIYDGVRNLRVYATQDKNLKISYKVNDQPMGSILEKPDLLQIQVSASDENKLDNIQRIELITHDGISAASKNFDSNCVNWNFTLDAQYSYYFVKITEVDGDIAVTAPCWTGK